MTTLERAEVLHDLLLQERGLTPPDWVSQIFLGVPMVVLYLVGVGVAWIFGGARKRAAKTEETETDSGTLV